MKEKKQRQKESKKTTKRERATTDLDKKLGGPNRPAE
ncbi:MULTISPECIES: spore protein [Bacillaceae]|nr:MULTISPECIES: spore protein [Bacillaceae]